MSKQSRAGGPVSRGGIWTDRSSLLLTVAPTTLAGIATAFMGWAQLDGGMATILRTAAIIAGAVATALLLIKAVREDKEKKSATDARYETMKELRNKLGPALDLMAEIASVDPADSSREVLHESLKTIATHCCSALGAMMPASTDVRAIVYAVKEPNELYPLARLGRNDVPRTFSFDKPDGAEILTYLSGSSPEGELYTDTSAEAPEHYKGDQARYRTFIRAPIWSSGAIFGMVAVDAPRAGSLSKGDVFLAELIAAELAPAFAIAAAVGRS
ncbi:hypothetical protein [Paenarthrobacter sp. A20]|uniref:hypothetical protein n=1 Tax=Paenarthrobacter sp. A20 TaxID=2817891 RepID=UPI0020A18EC3|nr:hypothetical protein [Paenarthrobacter sp. A20]MCP1415444.1 hypothetical protein [Paenarthrobacter sp. A20]